MVRLDESVIDHLEICVDHSDPRQLQALLGVTLQKIKNEICISEGGPGDAFKP